MPSRAHLKVSIASSTVNYCLLIVNSLITVVSRAARTQVTPGIHLRRAVTTGHADEAVMGPSSNLPVKSATSMDSADGQRDTAFIRPRRDRAVVTGYRKRGPVRSDGLSLHFVDQRRLTVGNGTA
jgi:hypothetical protein